MKDTKLIQILKTFSKVEIKEFEKFVASPYFSRGRDLNPFYKILKSFHPDFNNPIFTYESIFKKLYPKEKYKKSSAENVIRVLSTEMVKLADKFLSYEEFQSHKLRNRMSLIQVYITRKLNKLYIKLFDDTQQNLDKLIDGYTTKDFFELYVLKMYAQMFSIHNNDKVKNKSILESQAYLLMVIFMCTANSIDNSYKGNMAYNLDKEDDLAENLMRNFDYSNFITYLNKKTGLRKIDKELLELCLYGLLYTLDRDNEDIVLRLEYLFYKYKHLFRNDHKLEFYFKLNDAFDKRNDLKKSNILYRKLLEDEIYGQHNHMPFVVFMNILFYFAETKPDDAETFILEYSEILNTDKKDSFINYGYALIEFKRKNFEIALGYISKVDNAFFFFKYHLKTLYLQIYYELGYTEEANSMIDSFRHFLKNNKNVPEGRALRHKIFMGYYKKLQNLKFSTDKSDLQKLNKDILKEEKILFFKNWFLDKIKELR